MKAKKKFVMVSLATLMVISQMTGYSYLLEKDEATGNTFYIAPGVNSGNIYITDKTGSKVKIDGAGTAVGVLDDAVKLGHPGLGSVTAGKERYEGKGKIILKNDYSKTIDGNQGQSEPFESIKGPYHGMHVIGIIGANGVLNGMPYRGVAPETQIVFDKVQSYFNSNMIKDQDFADALIDMAGSVDSINLSLGVESATMNQASSFTDAINRVSDMGVPIVTTAGNEGYVGYSKNHPYASNPDYGTVSRSGIVPQEIM